MFHPPTYFSKGSIWQYFLLFGSLTANYFEFDIWIAPGGGMLGKRHSLFIELCIIELPLSRVLVEFGLNSIHFGFLSNFNPEYQISKFAWKLLLLKKFWVLFPKHFNHQKLQSIPFHNVETIIVVITKSATRVLKRWRQISFSVLTTSSILLPPSFLNPCYIKTSLNQSESWKSLLPCQWIINNVFKHSKASTSMFVNANYGKIALMQEERCYQLMSFDNNCTFENFWLVQACPRFTLLSIVFRKLAMFQLHAVRKE